MSLKTTQMMFEHSEQVVLLLDAAMILYTNPRAKKLFSADPTGESLSSLTEHKFVQVCFSRQAEVVTYHKNIRFGDRCFHVSRISHYGMTLLFLHPREDTRFSEFFLHDTIRSLLMKIKALPDNSQTFEIERLATATLAVASPVGTITDLRDFLVQTLSHFDCLSDKIRFKTELDDRDAPVLLYAELMQFTLIWMILDLLKLAGPGGTLSFSYERLPNSARLTFQIKTSVSPELVDRFRTSLTADANDVSAPHMNALFRARRVFSLHGCQLQYTESETGFTVFAEIPVSEYPSTLYAPADRYLGNFPFSPEEMRSLILGYLEEA